MKYAPKYTLAKLTKNSVVQVGRIYKTAAKSKTLCVLCLYYYRTAIDDYEIQ